MGAGIACRIGNYHHAAGALREASFELPRKGRQRKARRRTFKVGIAGAYNAFGLIGSECNGLFILDEDLRRVVLDEHGREGSGYNGPSTTQWVELARVCSLSWDDFRAFVNGHKRARYNLDESPAHVR